MRARWSLHCGGWKLPTCCAQKSAGRTLSQEQGLTPYDAAYLELAIRLGLPLATGDKELIAAAQRLGVTVLTP
jgi:rRNA-processing protein FCF1